MNSFYFSVIFLTGLVLVVRSYRAAPFIPEAFNATVSNSEIFDSRVKNLKIQIFANFSSQDFDPYPAFASENDTSQSVSIMQRYFNQKEGYLYTLYNNTCTKKPIYEIDVDNLIEIPSFVSSALILGFNTAMRPPDFVKTFTQCPHRTSIPCDQWSYYNKGLVTNPFDHLLFDAYLTSEGIPIAFDLHLQTTPSVIVKFESFYSGSQPQSRFMPAHPEKCQ